MTKSSDAQTERFPIWKTVTIGALRRPNVAQDRLKEAGINVDHVGVQTLWRVPYLEFPATLNLVVVTVEELGLRDGTITFHVYKRAKSYGLDLCPAEVAPQLWLSYPDLLQPGESVQVAMTAIVTSDNFQTLFRLDHDDKGRYLNGRWGTLEKAQKTYYRFVFVRP